MQFDLNLSSKQVINLGISGIIGLSLGDTFLFKAFQIVGARISMLIMSLAPAIAALVAYFILGESLSFVGVLGIFVTIFGVSVVVHTREENSLEKKRPKTFGVI